MPLIPQQRIVTVKVGPAQFAVDDIEAGAAIVLERKLQEFPPCRIVSITSAWHGSQAFCLIAVVEDL